MPAEQDTPYPSLDAYAYIGDGHTSALVSMWGSIDWCCMPRMDSPACFGRLLDWDRGGHLTLAPSRDGWEVARRYLSDTLVLETTFSTHEGRVRVLDFVAMRQGGRLAPHRQVVRICEGLEGEVAMSLRGEPRHEYGAVAPWVRRHSENVVSAVGGSTGLLFSGDLPLQVGRGSLWSDFTLRAGERRRLAVGWHPPHVLDHSPPDPTGPEEIDGRLDETVAWWERWSQRLSGDPGLEAARHSARVLKAMIDPPTGAMVAAPTTSLPEAIGEGRNWDYRYSWIRDSIFAVRALTELGAFEEADGFRRFIQRSSAGDASEMKIVYGVDGGIRLPEYELELEGYRGSAPVRVGNAAYHQLQLDTYGYLLELAWEWHERAVEPEPAYWEAIVDTAQVICTRWNLPDQGIWEIRAPARHFVHSKVMCWAGLEHALALARRTGFDAPTGEWKAAADAIRGRVLAEGVRDGCFVQAFGRGEVDAALLMLPLVGFVPADDPMMVRTTDRIMDELAVGGSRLIRRYRTEDGLEGEEGAFLACCFWLVEVLVGQGRVEEAKEVYRETVSTAGPLGLFSEEFDPVEGIMLGNYPQALSHLGHIEATTAMLRAEKEG